MSLLSQSGYDWVERGSVYNCVLGGWGGGGDMVPEGWWMSGDKTRIGQMQQW